MKLYTFYDDSWWDSCGCSCYPDILMEAFNSEDTDPTLGTAHSIEDCWQQAIITEIGRWNLPEDYEESLWEMSIEQLKEEAKNLNIEIEIVS